MIEYYLQIRTVHIWAISLSGGLFLLRAFSSILGANWPHNMLVRILSYLIDITLLTAATMLWTMLPKEIFANNWLNVKLVMVVLYIAAGFIAMRKTNPKPMRIAFFMIAIAIFWGVYTIARAHNPMAFMFWN